MTTRLFSFKFYNTLLFWGLVLGSFLWNSVFAQCPNAPNAGTDSSLTICTDDAPIDLFDFLGGSPDANGTWSPALHSETGRFDPSIDLQGSYTYTVSSTTCDLTDISEITVAISETPNTSGTFLEATSTICIGTDVAIRVSGANELTDGNYTIDYELTGTNNISNTTDIEVTSGNALFSISKDIILNSGTTMLAVTGFYYSNKTCSGNIDVIDPIELNIFEIRTPQISDEGNLFSSQEHQTISDLTNIILDTEPIIWYNLPENGSAYSELDPLQDGVSYYAAIQEANGCESKIRLEVKVSFTESLNELVIPDGFSPNGDSINDTFRMLNIETLYPNFKLSVYNRYGNILYEGNINSQPWDGTSKNSDKILPVGVYFYIIEFNDGQRGPQKGRVYLSR